MKTGFFNKQVIGGMLVIFTMLSCASSNDFLSGNFTKVRASHQKIAILPFQAKFDYDYGSERDNKRNAEKNKKGVENQEFLAGKDAQQELFKLLAKQVKKGRFELAIQDFNRTNKILDENNINLERFDDSNFGNLAKILGVDAIITGNLTVKVSTPSMNSFIPPNRLNDGVEAQAKLFDGATGEMLWSKNLSQRPNSPNDTPHRITTSILDNIAKSVPYRQK